MRWNYFQNKSLDTHFILHQNYDIWNLLKKMLKTLILIGWLKIQEPKNNIFDQKFNASIQRDTFFTMIALLSWLNCLLLQISRNSDQQFEKCP